MLMRFAPLAFVAVVLVACGDPGPSESDVEGAMNKAIGEVLGAEAKLTVDKAECTSADKVTYTCVTTFTLVSGTSSTTETEPVTMVKQGDVWVATPE